MKINLVLPFFPLVPVGGIKIMYQLGNLLADKGHEVFIYHTIKTRWRKENWPAFLRFTVFALMYVIFKMCFINARPKWFKLDVKIKSFIIPYTSDKYILDADCLISTMWQLAYEINDLSNSKGRKFNLIQGYETWIGTEELVHQSYKISVTHIVISSHLNKIFKEITGKEAHYLSLAIDPGKFNLLKPVEKRKNSTVIMLYSKFAIKGSKIGIEALIIAKQKFPELEVILFGVSKRPANIPVWINYYQRPTNLNILYNEAAIFISPSLTEGWALPPAEAMHCGCAVICTKIGGHMDYGKDQQTLLFVTPGDSFDLLRKMEILLRDERKRMELAIAGNQTIQKFTWPSTLSILEKIISL